MSHCELQWISTSGSAVANRRGASSTSDCEGSDTPHLRSRPVSLQATSRGSLPPPSVLELPTGPQIWFSTSPASDMEALGGYPTRSSNPKAKRLTVLLSMTVGVGCLFLLQTRLLQPRRPTDFYSFEVKDAKGRTVSLEKYRGKVGPHHHPPAWPRTAVKTRMDS